MVTGTIWAIIQVEFLTYRRISEGDSWLSHYFSMQAVDDYLEGQTTKRDMPFLKQDMLKSFTRCGWFYDDFKGLFFFVPTAEDVRAFYFMNLQDCIALRFGKLWGHCGGAQANERAEASSGTK